MSFFKTCFTGGLLTLSLISSSAFADWVVDNQQSKVFFISTKNINVSEVHHFKNISGTLAKNGTFALDIDLASVETGIEIRNTRMQEHLFKVSVFPKAHIEASIPSSVIKLQKGHNLHTQIPAVLSLMGIEKALDLDVIINKTNDQDFVVSSAQPILISAADVGLKEGVETLQKIAGLSSIGLTVPVSFNLVLSQD